ncbi:hypothetical protein CSOJ01_01995 [Colletotrichum sojae]|uniref:Uncharacterized protein n=1 Tax=Colletotrichum sojae TaxID=2175907 RepID=A0A8H6JRP1_9PEZI|nr:hypothetical protein CSOJ01_01995 [Colletotrichum sojae]
MESSGDARRDRTIVAASTQRNGVLAHLSSNGVGTQVRSVTTAAASDFDSGATSAARNQVGASSRRERTDTDALCSRLQIGAGTGLQVPKMMGLLISHDTLVDYDCLAGWPLQLKTCMRHMLECLPSGSSTTASPA